MTIALINGICSNSLLDAALILHTYGPGKWGRGLALGLYWPPPSVFYLEMFRGILHAWTESHGGHSGTSHASGSSQGRLDAPTSQLSILQVVSVSRHTKGPSPHGEAKCRSILGQSESPCHPPYSLFWSGTCLSPPSPASFFDGPYISLLGVPQLNIHTRRFKPRTFIFCGLSPWPAQGHFSLCLPRSFFCVHISLVFVYVSTCLLLIETPVTLGSPTLTASF